MVKVGVTVGVMVAVGVRLGVVLGVDVHAGGSVARTMGVSGTRLGVFTCWICGSFPPQAARIRIAPANTD
jgi:hypothetical protein